MKNLIYIFLITLISVFSTSCKKEPKNHKIKYDIEFHQVPDYGYTNWMELGVTPSYVGEYNNDTENATINYEMAKTGEWDYEYWMLHDGDLVTFSLLTAEGYYYSMRIYIDGTEVSYKKIYSGQVVESSGLGAGDNLDINFTYYE